MKGDEKAMAITYKKALKTVVFTLHDASTVTAADTVDKAIGSEALGMYDAKGVIVVPGENNITKFDYSQVVKAVITIAASEDITRVDPYCGESGETGETETGETETGETGETA